MILFERLTKRCGPPTSVSDVFLEVPAGEVCALLGPDRAGKATAPFGLAPLLSATWGTTGAGGDCTQDDSAGVAPSGVMAQTGEATLARSVLSLIRELMSDQVVT